MLPTNSISGRRERTTHQQYFRRLVRPKQMDFEFALWLMLQLCVAPKKAYLHTSFHKETKNQWSRDDPAYLVLLLLFILLSACIHYLTYGHGVGRMIQSIVYIVFGDFLLFGASVATVCWFLANRFLLKRSHGSQLSEQVVEWLYAFDVQCNSYFVLFLCLHVVQFIFSPVLLSKNFVAGLLSNVLYTFAFSYYHYLNFLGYSSLPFLEHTELFLYPIGLLILLLPISVIARFNPTRFVYALYFGK